MYSYRTVSSDTQQEQASRHLGRSLKKPFYVAYKVNTRQYIYVFW